MSKAIDIATKLIKLNEGLRLEIYTCDAGFKTFGFGTNLEVLEGNTNKIIDEINNFEQVKETLAVDLMQREIINCNKALKTQKWFTDDLSHFQQAIILDLAYNMGVSGVLVFNNMIKAIKQRNYGIAFAEMLDSKYHYQMICFGYADELADAGVDKSDRTEVFSWYNDLQQDTKQLRSLSNAVSLQFDTPLGKYKELF
jgi:lysozyme